MTDLGPGGRGGGTFSVRKRSWPINIFPPERGSADRRRAPTQDSHCAHPCVCHQVGRGLARTDTGTTPRRHPTTPPKPSRRPPSVLSPVRVRYRRPFPRRLPPIRPRLPPGACPRERPGFDPVRFGTAASVRRSPVRLRLPPFPFGHRPPASDGRSDTRDRRLRARETRRKAVTAPDQTGDQPHTEHSVAPESWSPPQSGHCFLL
jgi:hypothetical protein